MSGDTYHEPVMVREVLRHLEPHAGGRYLDGTVGGGGHARAILEACPDCRLVGVDRDPDALGWAREALATFGERVRLLRGRFDEVMASGAVEGPLAGALLDLGVSSHQLDADERGFGFRPGLALDMRMEGREAGETAADLLNEASEETLARWFREYGEERRARRLAREVVRRRAKRPLLTSDDFMAAVRVALGRSPSPRDKARLFQALRIAVNRELESLEAGLERIREHLGAGAPLVVLSYHSLEDRTVKNAFRDWSAACVCPPSAPVCTCRGSPLGELLTKRPLRPSEEEVRSNPRARSARLRAWRRAA